MRNYREEWAEGEIEASALLDEIDELSADRATLQQMAYCLKDHLEAAESARRDDYQNWMTALDRNAELLAKLEAAEKDIALKERIIDSLGSELNAVANERDDLLARIREMERQEPVAWMDRNGTLYNTVSHVRASDKPLYLAPGAKGDEK